VADEFGGLGVGLNGVDVRGMVMLLVQVSLREAEVQKLVAYQIGDRTVWLEAGSKRHFVGLSPRQLLRLTRAETGTFLRDD